MIKGKNGFWLLVIIFSLIIMMVVLSGENYGMKIVNEMDGTMGLMMAKQHAAGAALGDLFNSAWSHQFQSMEGHGSTLPLLKFLDTGSFALILLLLPLIVGTSVVMIILWI